MKQRKIWTKIWKDDWFCKLSQSARMLFLYLITNEDIGFTGCYELSDRQIIFDTKLTGLEKLKKELFPKIKFLDGWIYVVNAQGYNGFVGESFEVAISKEKLSIPQNVKDTLIKGEVYPTPPVTPPSGGDHSSNIYNNNIYKKEVVKEKTYTDKNLTLNQVAEKINEAFNVYLGRKFKGIDSFKSNLEYWLNTYEPKEIAKAIKNIKFDKYWGEGGKGEGGMTPTLLFRRKNPQGENVDYISQLLLVKENYD